MSFTTHQIVHEGRKDVYKRQEMLYQQAYIVEAEPGLPGVLKVLPPYDDRYHTFRTSPIVRCTPWFDEPSTIIMETENTTYTLDKL